ncbi:MAG TPA: DegT/DnrJ/EryC1/StrS family aminotransferase [Chitinophagales bacterium]|nr:DegT/DnrJ/EryC1/StrS family aminotransferase [Chitinophagales bacterium]
MKKIRQADLSTDYLQVAQDVNTKLTELLTSGTFIGGQEVSAFERALSEYLGVKRVISCGNGTDALQLALMSLNLPRGSKIIVPAFTYIAPIEVIKLLGFEPVYADVDVRTFNICLSTIADVYTEEVKAIVVVHLFGQLISDIDEIAKFCDQKQITLIEDNAQSLGAEKKLNRNSICTTSFFPTKNLGCYGDGGAIYTNDEAKANTIRMMANHGQSKKYYHDIIGINSRLDALQAGILNVKLPGIDQLIQKKKNISYIYDECFKNIPFLTIPIQESIHTFHQYTLIVDARYRDELQNYLADHHIESTVYYPLPAYKQKAYLKDVFLPVCENLCQTVLSIPIHLYLSESEISYICETIVEFYKNKS